MATITTLGVGSGIDLAGLAEQLREAENAKLNVIMLQKNTLNAQLSAYGKMKSALVNLQTASQALSKNRDLEFDQGNSTHSGFSATTASGAVAGNYSVKIDQVAKAHTLMTGSHTSNTAQLDDGSGTRTLTLTQPGVKDENGQVKPLEIELADGDTSLEGIAKAINKANGNVSATVIKGSDNDYQLMLTSKTTGTDSEMTISVDDANLQAVIGNAAMTEQSTAQNAKMTVNGVAIERQSNVISDALPGVTFTLKSTTAAEERLEIGASTDANYKAIEEWVTAWNNLQTIIASVTKYTMPEKGEFSAATDNGALVGDGNVRSIQSQLRNLLTEVQGGSIPILANIGVTQDPVRSPNGETGMLKIDTDKLTKMLKENPDGVKKYFTGDGTSPGLANQMVKMTTQMLSTDETSSGVIKNAQDRINASLKTASQRYERTERLIEATMARYTAQFNALDTLVSQMHNMSNYLTNQFSAMNVKS